MLLSSLDTKRTLEHWCIYSCLQISPREKWFQYVRTRRVYYYTQPQLTFLAASYPLLEPMEDAKKYFTLHSCINKVVYMNRYLIFQKYQTNNFFRFICANNCLILAGELVEWFKTVNCVYGSWYTIFHYHLAFARLHLLHKTCWVDSKLGSLNGRYDWMDSTVRVVLARILQL